MSNNLYNVNVSTYTNTEYAGDVNDSDDFIGSGEGQIAGYIDLIITPDNSANNIASLQEGQQYVVSAAAFSVQQVGTDEQDFQTVYGGGSVVVGSSTTYYGVPNYIAGIDQGDIEKVNIRDLCCAGEPDNTVRVRVYLVNGFTMPDNDYTIHVDLDGGATVWSPPQEENEVESYWSFVLTNIIWPEQRPQTNMNGVTFTPSNNLDYPGTVKVIGGATSIRNSTNGGVGFFQAVHTFDRYQDYLTYEAVGRQNPNAIENCTITPFNNGENGFEDATWSMNAGEDFPRADLYSVKWKITGNEGYNVDAADFQIMGWDCIHLGFDKMLYSQIMDISGVDMFISGTQVGEGMWPFGNYCNSEYFVSSTDYYNGSNYFQMTEEAVYNYQSCDCDANTTGQQMLAGEVNSDWNHVFEGMFYWTNGPGSNTGIMVDEETGEYSWNQQDHLDLFKQIGPGYGGSILQTAQGGVYDYNGGPFFNTIGTEYDPSTPCYDYSGGYSSEAPALQASGWSEAQYYGATSLGSIPNARSCNTAWDQWGSNYIGKIPWQEKYYYTAQELEEDIFPGVIWADQWGNETSYPPQSTSVDDYGNTVYGENHYYEPPSNYDYGAYVWHFPRSFHIMEDYATAYPDEVADGTYPISTMGPIQGCAFDRYSTSPVRPRYNVLRKPTGSVPTSSGGIPSLAPYSKILLYNTNPGADNNEVIVEAFIREEAVRLFNGDILGGTQIGLDPDDTDVTQADWYDTNVTVGLQINGQAQAQPQGQGAGGGGGGIAGMPAVSPFQLELIDNLLDSNSGNINIEPKMGVGIKKIITNEGQENQETKWRLFGNIRKDDNKSIATITIEADKDSDGNYKFHFPDKLGMYQSKTGKRLGFNFTESLRLVYKERSSVSKYVYDVFLDLSSRKVDFNDIKGYLKFKQKEITIKTKAVRRVDVGKTIIGGMGENKRIKVFGTPGSKFIVEFNKIILELDDGSEDWSVDGVKQETSRTIEDILAIKNKGNPKYDKQAVNDGVYQIKDNGNCIIDVKIPKISRNATNAGYQEYQIKIKEAVNANGENTAIIPGDDNTEASYTVMQYPTPSLTLTVGPLSSAPTDNSYTIQDQAGTTGSAGANSVITYKGALNKTSKQLENSRKIKTLINFKYLLDLTDNTKIFQTAIIPDDWENSFSSENGGTTFQFNKVSWTAVNANTITLTGELRIIKWGIKSVNLKLDLDKLITHNA